MLPYNNINLKTNKILEQLTLSSRALAELKGYANTIPNMHILINAVTINEAKDSSAIENIVTTHDDIYKVLTESGYKEKNAKEVEMKNYKEEFKNKLPKIYSKELLESLFYEVYTKISYIENSCNVTRITATSYLNQLEKIGLLESEKVGRERLYKNMRLINILSEN